MAEYYAMVTGCAEDLGWKADVWLWTDNSAAKARASSATWS